MATNERESARALVRDIIGDILKDVKITHLKIDIIAATNVKPTRQICQ